MLDFYWLMGTEEMPEYPDEDRYIGRLEYRQAEVLMCVWEQCSTLSHPNRGEIYISSSDDFVLRSHETKALLRICKDCLAKIDPINMRTVKYYNDFIALLEEQAVQEEHRGLAAYCD
jgi:hypothetical protein